MKALLLIAAACAALFIFSGCGEEQQAQSPAPGITAIEAPPMPELN